MAATIIPSDKLLGWFYAKDLIIDAITALALFVIFLFAVKFYRIHSQQKKYVNLILSFGLLFLALLVKILTHFSIYYSTVQTKHIGFATITFETIQSSGILSFWGLLLYRVFSLLAFYLLYLSYTEKIPAALRLFTIYLLLLAAFLSTYYYYIFHLTALVLLFLIADNLYRISQKNNNVNTRMLAYCFFILFLSNVLFLFIGVHPLLHAAGEIIQLLGSLLLLFTLIQVLHHAKKTG